jgi:hypothetical protein
VVLSIEGVGVFLSLFVLRPLGADLTLEWFSCPAHVFSSANKYTNWGLRLDLKYFFVAVLVPY